MPFTVTHFLVAAGVVALYYKLSGKRASTWTLFIAGIGGTILDADILFNSLLSWTAGTAVDAHRVYTHNLIVPIVAVLLAALLTAVLSQNRKFKLVAPALIVFAAGWVIHIILDCAIAWTPAMSLIPGVLDIDQFCGPDTGWKFQGALDGILFGAWVCYLLLAKKLKDIW